MEEYESFETVRQKLIIAGIKELEGHGFADFSLRRVASACGVSCAAPYKHFKSKEDFISEIIQYIHRQWILLQNQIAEIYNGDVKKQLTETCIAYIKFWIANPNFRTVLMIKSDEFGNPNINVRSHMTECTKKLIHEYCKKSGIKPDDEKRKTYIVRSLVYGAALMIDNGELENSKETIDMIRKSIEREFETA